MCDTLVVVRPDGAWFGKNSDRDPNEAQLLEQRPRSLCEEGQPLRCTYISVPQVKETYAALLSRPFWMWGAEMGTNEHGVTIGNEAVFTNEPLAPEGLTGMDLVRLALERAKTASGAVDVITSLLEQHGQGGGCGHEKRGFSYHNSFLICDPRGAFVVETAGRKWKAERTGPGVRTLSNGLTLHGFKDEHQDSLRSRVAACEVRQELTSAAVKRAEGAGDVMAALRGHGRETWPRYALLNGTLSMPCMHGGGLLAGSVTTASFVADLAPDRAPLCWVTATSAPCLSLYKPLRVMEPVDAAGSPSDVDDGGASLWWAHERLHRLVMSDPRRLAPLFLAERDEVQARWLAAPPGFEEACREHRRLLEAWTARVEAALAEEPGDVRPWLVRRYWKKRQALASA